jgi:hypothetical protein
MHIGFHKNKCVETPFIFYKLKIFLHTDFNELEPFKHLQGQNVASLKPQP